jgi:hypothetical protein
MPRVHIYGLALVILATAPASLLAQGIPAGSTKVAGSPDSAFSRFLTFLRGRGVALIRTDSARHRFEAKLKDSDEPVLYAFTAAGDSTAISAQGARGGMAAMIFALGQVNDWLESRDSSGRARKP